MESAIPEHLRSARTRHRRVPDDYAPPYPSFVARHKPAAIAWWMARCNMRPRLSGDETSRIKDRPVSSVNPPTYCKLRSVASPTPATHVITKRPGPPARS